MKLNLLLPGNVLLSQGRTLTTIGAEELNFRVRDGNGCDLFAIATRQIIIDIYYYNIFYEFVKRNFPFSQN